MSSRHRQEEIAESIGEPIGTIKRLTSDGEDSLVRKVFENQTNQINANHLTDFEPPIYNIWKQQEKTNCFSLFFLVTIVTIFSLANGYTWIANSLRDGKGYESDSYPSLSIWGDKWGDKKRIN